MYMYMCTYMSHVMHTCMCTQCRRAPGDLSIIVGGVKGDTLQGSVGVRIQQSQSTTLQATAQGHVETQSDIITSDIMTRIIRWS